MARGSIARAKEKEKQKEERKRRLERLAQKLDLEPPKKKTKVKIRSVPFQPGPQKKYLIDGKYFPIYSDNPKGGHYMLDLAFIGSRRKNKKTGKKKKLSVPYLIAVHVNFRVAHMIPLPSKFITERDGAAAGTRSGQKPTTERISVDAKGTLEAFRQLNDSIAQFRKDLKKEFGSTAKDGQKFKRKEFMKVRSIQVDEGSEFMGVFKKYCEDNGIYQYTVKPSESTKRSQGIVERFIRTIRRFQRIWYLTNKSSFKLDPNQDVEVDENKLKDKNVRIPYEKLNKVIEEAVEHYNFDAPHRYVRQMIRKLENKTENSNLARNTKVAPAALANYGDAGEKKIIKIQQRKTSAVGLFWRSRTNKIINEGGTAIEWEDKENKFAKTTDVKASKFLAGGQVHRYEKRHDGDRKRSVHGGEGNNPLRTATGRSKGAILGGTGRSLKFRGDSRRYLPYDFYVDGDKSIIEKRRENKKFRGRNSKYVGTSLETKRRTSWKKQKKQNLKQM